MSRKGKFRERKSQWFPRTGEQNEEWRLTANGYKVSFWDDKNVFLSLKYGQKALTYNFQYLYLFENNDVRENIHFYSSADNFLSKCIISLFNIAKSKIEFF